MNPVQLVQLVYCSTCMALLVIKILLGLNKSTKLVIFFHHQNFVLYIYSKAEMDWVQIV